MVDLIKQRESEYVVELNERRESEYAFELTEQWERGSDELGGHTVAD